MVSLRAAIAQYGISVLRVMAGVAGLLLLSTVFLYEDQRGKIQSSIEDLWIRVDDLQKGALSRHAAFLHVLARVMTSALDRILGQGVFSLQSIGVWICYSLGSIGLLSLMPWAKNNYSFIATVWVLFFFAFGTIPALIPKHISDAFLPSGWLRRDLPPWLLIWFSLVALLFIKIIVWPLLQLEVHIILEGAPKGWLIFPLVTFAGMATAFFLFAFFMSFLRGTLRRVSTSTSASRVSLIYFLNAIPLFTFYGLYKLLIWRFETAESDTDYWSGVVSLLLMFGVFTGIFSNLGFALSAIIFVVLASTMLLHRLFWPMLQRPLYALQALGIASRHKLFVALGLAFFTIAIGKYEWLGKVLKQIF